MIKGFVRVGVEGSCFGALVYGGCGIHSVSYLMASAVGPVDWVDLEATLPSGLGKSLK